MDSPHPASDLSAEPQQRQRKIIHIDMDAFYASVEQRDDPTLRGKPLAVGGSRERGVVAAASYEARRFGVRSAMSGIVARRQCPELIFVRPRFDVYKAVSQQIRSVFAEHTPIIEPLSLDEAFLEPPALAGASRIIAVDIDDRKLELARKMGATHTVNSKDADPVDAIRELTPPPDGTGHEGGADVVIDAVGRPETWKQAFYARDLAGTVVLVGVPTPDMTIPEIPLIDVFGRGGALKSSWYGDCLPSRDFPMLVDLYQQGRLDLDAFVTERITIDQVEEAFAKMHEGKVLRSVVELPAAVAS